MATLRWSVLSHAISDIRRRAVTLPLAPNINAFSFEAVFDKRHRTLFIMHIIIASFEAFTSEHVDVRRKSLALPSIGACAYFTQ